MMIYIDDQYRCYVTADENRREIQTNSFDGKCQTFIEGYRFVPSGESWTRSDGVVFHGEMIAPWKEYSELAAAQREHERQLLCEYTEYLKILGVEV